MGTRLILGFAIAFFVLIIAPALLSQQLAAGAVPRYGDLVDLFTPFVLIPLYYALFRSADDWASDPPSGPMTALFMFGSILFINGQGMHLAANSIGHFLEASPVSDAYAITYFYDEVLSHYLWHAGVMALGGVLLWRHYQPVKRGVDMWRVGARQRWLLGAAAVLYGTAVALAAIEGQTAVMVLGGASVIALLFALSWRRQGQLPGAPVFSFFGLGYFISALLLAGWGLYWNGFPEFSHLGIIK